MESNVRSENQGQGTPNQSQVPDLYRFSPEEQRVLRQCNIESFYQRSLPFGTLMGVGTYYLVKSGYLRAHTRFGATPKICVAVIAGYFIGKLSYQQKCAEKLMALPNSHIGEILRQRKKQGISENLSLDTGFPAPIGIDTTSVEKFEPQQSYLNLDSDRPSYLSEYDKTLQDESSYDVSEIAVPPGGAPSTSYDELRRRNREEFDGSQRNKGVSLSRPVEPEEAPVVVRARAPPREGSSARPKNKYGDEWED